MTRLLPIIIFTVALLTFGVHAQKNSYVSTEGRFSLAVQGAPEKFAQDAPGTADGLIGFQWALKDRMISIVVTYTDNLSLRKEDGLAKRDQMASLMVKNFTADKFDGIIRRDIALSGYPGFEVTASNPSATVEKFGTTRTYIVGTRIFTAVVTYDAVEKVRAIQILDTFKVWEAPPVQTPLKVRTKTPRS